MDELLTRALNAATDAGADYADVRCVESTSEAISVRGPMVEALERSEGVGVGVRVLSGGAWGYAATAKVDGDSMVELGRTAVAVARASARVRSRPVELVPEPAHRAVWMSPVKTDPFEVSLDEKVGLLATAASAIEGRPGIRIGRASLDFIRQRIKLVTTEGTHVDQTITHSGGGIEATALVDDEVQTRSYPGSFRGDLKAAGYEFIESMNFPEHTERIADQAVALLSAPECPTKKTTVVLDGHQMMLQVHESVGHATELDRVLGMEASFAGTSFVELDHLNSYKYGSELVNIVSDATVSGGVGTFGYDDEGVAAQRTPLIENGILVGFQTSRETAAVVGADRSNGTMRAEGWENFPLIRMANVNLLPGEGSLEDLVADVDDGIYMATNKSWSIDDKRKNFQFGCEIAWEIKAGKLTRILKNPRYTGITPVFWASCDAIAGRSEWKMWGTPNCGKGQPGQTMRVGHGTAPARFRNVAVGVSQ
jgi:TldD protein